MDDADFPRALALDPDGVECAAEDRAMLDYVLKLTRTPSAMGAEDVGRLRQAGYSETAILDICQVAAYYAYVNRLADGLGVELEPYWDDDPESLTVTREEFAAR